MSFWVPAQSNMKMIHDETLASATIVQLMKLVDEYGDLPVYFYDSEMGEAIPIGEIHAEAKFFLIEFPEERWVEK